MVACPVDRPENSLMEFAPADERDVDAWCRTAMAMPPLTADQEARLGQLIEMGDAEAREWLVRAHLRLVVEAARRHAGDGTALLPVLQAGTAGLLHAVEAFDATTGERFAEHARACVDQAIQRTLAAS
jgi:DNA-directed RNA polymerase sigma subunit (sigma70/sigma32)